MICRLKLDDVLSGRTYCCDVLPWSDHFRFFTIAMRAARVKIRRSFVAASYLIHHVITPVGITLIVNTAHRDDIPSFSWRTNNLTLEITGCNSNNSISESCCVVKGPIQPFEFWSIVVPKPAQVGYVRALIKRPT